jgi:hypothetical protein
MQNLVEDFLPCLRRERGRFFNFLPAAVFL